MAASFTPSQRIVIPIRDASNLTVPAASAGTAVSADILDRRGRPVRDLRISVTDRCNFRCTYCMPSDVFGRDYAFLPHADLLSFEEMTRVTRALQGLGLQKVRITGGEPLLRRHIERLVEMLAGLGGLDLTLTTNGSLLARKARELRDAGLRRVTVSLDSLDERIFRAMNDVDFPVAKVLEGIDAAAAAGLAPIKINMVIKRGVNDRDAVAMAAHFKGSGHILRFIEFMDVGSTNGWRMDDVVPSAELVHRIDEVFPVEPVDRQYTGEVAERWRYRDGSGEIGFISSVTQAFCRDCTRLRLSPEGKLFTCLFASSGYDVRGLLRGDVDDGELSRRLAALWQQRSDHYSEVRTAATAAARKVEMSYIGG